MELWGREENGEKNLRGDCQCLCQSVFVTPCECIYVCIYYIYRAVCAHTSVYIHTHSMFLFGADVVSWPNEMFQGSGRIFPRANIWVILL